MGNSYFLCLESYALFPVDVTDIHVIQLQGFDLKVGFKWIPRLCKPVKGIRNKASSSEQRQKYFRKCQQTEQMYRDLKVSHYVGDNKNEELMSHTLMVILTFTWGQNKLEQEKKLCDFSTIRPQFIGILSPCMNLMQIS